MKQKTGQRFRALRRSLNTQQTLRLGKAERQAFLEECDTVLCEQHGRVMKEYLVVPDAVPAKTAKLKGFFAQSHSYVSSLKPKAKARKKKNYGRQEKT